MSRPTIPYDDEWGEQLVAEAAEMAMPDSKIRDDNGKLKVVYHQTNAVDEDGNPFTVFNMERARHTSDVVGAFFAPEYDHYHEYGDRTYAAYLNIKNPAYDVYVDNSITDAGLLKRNELIAQGYDRIINTEDGKPYEYVAFYPEQIKSVETFTEGDDEDLIPLSLRFNEYKEDIRWSRAEADNKKRSPSAAADPLNPALTSETTNGSSASVKSITEYEKYVKRKEAKARSKEAELDREYLQAILDKDEKKQLKMLREKLNNTEGDDEDLIPLSLRFNDYKEVIRWKRTETKYNEGFPGGSMVDDIDNMVQAVSPSADNINETYDTVKMDREYEAAVKRGDIRTATEMLMDKLRKTKGVIHFMVPEWDTGKYRETAKTLKT